MRSPYDSPKWETRTTKQIVCLGVKANSRRGLSESEASQPSNAPYLLSDQNLTNFSSVIRMSW